MVNIFLSEYNFHGEWAKDTIKKYINYCDKVAVIPFAFSEKWISNNVEWQNAYNRYYGNYYISPDEDYTDFMYCHGLELVNKDFYIEVHYEDTDIQNDCIKRVLKEKTDTIYAIKDNGGIIVDSGNLLLLGDVVTFKNN